MSEQGLTEIDNELLPARMIGEAAMNGIAAGGTLQQIRGSYATAIACQIPRQLDIVRRRIEDEGRLAGEDFYYGWGVGKEKIEGASIKLANALARCWGNCAIELLPVQETGDSWIFTAVFVDLETGFTLPRQFRQAKNWKVYGKHDEARKDDIRFQIGQSKAIRNVILNALPASLVDRAMIAAKSGVRSKLEAYITKNSLAAAQDLLVGELAKQGVKEDAILRRCRVVERKALSVEDLVILRGDIHALNEGQARPEELFPPSTADNLADKLETKTTAPNGQKTEEPKQDQPTAKPITKATLKKLLHEIQSQSLSDAGVEDVFRKAKVAQVAKYEELSESDGQKLLAELENPSTEAEGAGVAGTPEAHRERR